MATPELTPVGAEPTPMDVMAPADVAVGRSRVRHAAGLAGQYSLLVILALVVLGPLLLTLIQAMSPPFLWVTRGRPLHPVGVAWKDRTWFSGGVLSIVIRTLIVVAFFAWIQRVGSGGGWRTWRTTFTPVRIVSVVAASVVLTAMLGPTFRSLYLADGKSQWWILATMVLVAAATAPGLAAGGRRSPGSAVVSSAAVAFVFVGACVIFVGGVVWTQAWSSAHLGPAMRRSLTMTVLITVAQVTTSITSAYAFAFLRFPFKRLLFALFMGTLLLPLEVTLVGNVALIRQLGWINSMQGLVLPFGATALGTFLVRQGFRGIPPEIQDATRLDGYGHLSFLVRFAVPLTRPVIAAFTVIAALSAWNQYLWPRAVIDSDQYATLQIQLRTIVGSNVANANVSIASALVAAVPVLILLVAFQRQIIRGLTAGAVK